MLLTIENQNPTLKSQLVKLSSILYEILRKCVEKHCHRLENALSRLAFIGKNPTLEKEKGCALTYHDF